MVREGLHRLPLTSKPLARVVSRGSYLDDHVPLLFDADINTVSAEPGVTTLTKLKIVEKDRL